MEIRETPAAERPAGRLLAYGPGTLSDPELLHVLTGRPLSACDKVLEDGIGRLLTMGTVELAHLPDGAIARILAAVELGRRIARSGVRDREPLTHPAAVARYLALRYSQHDQEVMGALFLDTRNRLLGDREIFRGGLNRAAVEPRALLKEALLRGAAGIVLFHTHPSGDPAPSAEDLAFTRRFAESCETVGVRLLDHLVLGDANRWVSLRERGCW